MPIVTQIALMERPEQNTLSIRTKTAIGELPGLIGRCYQKIGKRLNELGELLSDVPYVAYHNLDMQDLDVEIGFPVPRALSGKDDVNPGAIPGGKAVFCVYRGAYSKIEQAYAEALKWIGDNGMEPAGTFYEYYYNGPDIPESELLTRIIIPVL